MPNSTPHGTTFFFFASYRLTYRFISLIQMSTGIENKEPELPKIFLGIYDGQERKKENQSKKYKDDQKPNEVIELKDNILDI